LIYWLNSVPCFNTDVCKETYFSGNLCWNFWGKKINFWRSSL